MANRVPLIVDTTNLHLKELPLGDALDLTGCGIVGIASFTPGTGGGTRFIGITTFGDGTGAATTGVYVNDGLLANYLKASNLTDNQVVTAGAGGSITASSNLTFDESTLAVTGALTVSGNVDLGDAAADTITATGKFDSSLIPASDSVNLGSSTDEWGDLYIDGTANIDALVADSAKISDLTDNRVVIAGTAGELEDSANLTFDGSTLTVTGDLDVTGSLNYSNVTDIYSVGVITAAANVQVGAGISVVGVSTFTGTNAGAAHTCLKLTNLGTTDDSAVRITHVMKDDGDNLQDVGYINMIADDTANGGEDSSIDFWTTSGGATGLHTKLFTGDSHGGKGLGIGTAGVVKNGLTQARAMLDVDGTVHIEGRSNHVGMSTFNADVNFVGAGAGISSAFWDQSAASLKFKDDAKAEFGDSQDLTIYHTGGHTWLKNDTGYLRFATDGSGFTFSNEDNSTPIAQFVKGGKCELYNNGNLRIGADSHGAFITGIATVSSTSHMRIPVGDSNQRPGASIRVDGDIRYNTDTNSFEGYGNGAWGGLGGGTEIDETITSTSAQNLTTFAKADYRSASLRIQIVQGTAYQVGRYLLIHDGTTATIVEEAAIATGSMLGTISAVINSSNVEVKVTMGSASSATITTIIDKITV